MDQTENNQGFGKYLILQIQNSFFQEPVSERLGPVPADLQAWAKSFSCHNSEQEKGGQVIFAPFTFLPLLNYLHICSDFGFSLTIFCRKKSRSRSPVTRKRSTSRDKERGRDKETSRDKERGRDKETSRTETKSSADLRRRGKRSPSPSIRERRSPSPAAKSRRSPSPSTRSKRSPSSRNRRSPSPIKTKKSRRDRARHADSD